MKLSNNELWKHIKALVGKTVCTITKGIPNKILGVTDNKVKIEGKTPVGFKRERGIFANYDTLIKDGYLIGKSGEDRIMKANIYSPTRYVIMAILHGALPDETERIKGGIKLREV